MNWVLLPQAIVNGILRGGVIGLIALGIVLIYKSSEIFNFAQGHLLMLGAYLTWWFALIIKSGSESIINPFWLVIIAGFFASIASMGIGFLIERLALRPMTGQPLLSIVLMTLGLAQLIEGLVSLGFGVQPRSNFPEPISRIETFKIPFKYAFNETIFVQKLLVVAFVAAIIFAILIGLFFKFSKVGLAMRATSEDHELAQSIGLNVPRIFGVSWAFAGVVATVGGTLLAMLTGASLTLSTVVLVAFPAILLGGLESLPGAVIGGLVVGLAGEVVKAAANGPLDINKSSVIAPYVLLLILLFIRPEGLFGRKRIERI